MTYLSINKAAKLLGMNPGSVRRKCAAGKYIGAKKESGKWLIPTTAHEKLRQLDHLVGSDELGHLPARKREAAIRRLGLINSAEEYAAGYVRNGGCRSNAIKIFATQNKLSWQSLYRWIKAYRRYGLMGLVDSRGSSNIAEPVFTPEAANELLILYLNQNKLSLKQCYQNVLFINKQQNKDWQIPALRTVHKWVTDNVPQPVIILHRDGKEAYERLCAPYVETDITDIAPGSYWIGDHHQFDFWILYKNKWIRPWLTCWQDMRSRAIVGWHICASPNQTTILLAMRAGIELYGPPDAVKIDNGKDYDSQMWTGVTKAERRVLKKKYLDENLMRGLYGMMGISVSFAQPYHPQAKAVERLFRTIEEQFGKTIETYTGNCPDNRPENLAHKLTLQSVIDRGLNFDDLADKFSQYVTAYNNTVHTGKSMDGRSPNQVMRMRTSKRAINPDILDMLLCVWSGKLKVGKNGVRFKHLLYGQYEPRLHNHFGKYVRVSYNPNDLRQVTVYDFESMQRICIAEQNQLIKYNQEVGEETLREATRQKANITKAHKNWISKRSAQYMSVTDLTIKAINDSAVSDDTKSPAPAIRPVKTPLDLQLDGHLRERKQKILRKAAGAENTPVIDMDLSSLTRPTNKTKTNLKLFENG